MADESAGPAAVKRAEIHDRLAGLRSLALAMQADVAIADAHLAGLGLLAIVESTGHPLEYVSGVVSAIQEKAPLPSEIGVRRQLIVRVEADRAQIEARLKAEVDGLLRKLGRPAKYRTGPKVDPALPPRRRKPGGAKRGRVNKEFNRPPPEKLPQSPNPKNCP